MGFPMGARTTVVLTVRAVDFENHISIFEGPDRKEVLQDGLVSLVYEGVGYEMLGFEKKLQELRIPYTRNWDSDEDLEGGAEYFRILSNGETDLKLVYLSDEYCIGLDEAIQAFEQGRIGEFLQAERAKRTAISWPEQIAILNAQQPK